MFCSTRRVVLRFLLGPALPDAKLPSLAGGDRPLETVEGPACALCSTAKCQGIGRDPGGTATPFDLSAHDLLKALRGFERRLSAPAKTTEIGDGPSTRAFVARSDLALHGQYAR